MKKITFAILTIILGTFFLGCIKKEKEKDMFHWDPALSSEGHSTNVNRGFKE